MRVGYLKNISFFQKKEDGFISMIVPNLSSINFQIKEFIYRKGENPSNMYFIVNGRINFITDTFVIFKTFTTGSYFGEYEIVKNHKYRKNTIITEKTVETLILSKLMYHKIVESEYPEIHQEIKFISKIRYKRLKKDEKHFGDDFFNNSHTDSTSNSNNSFSSSQERENIIGKKFSINSINSDHQNISNQINANEMKLDVAKTKKGLDDLNNSMKDEFYKKINNRKRKSLSTTKNIPVVSDPNIIKINKNSYNDMIFNENKRLSLMSDTVKKIVNEFSNYTSNKNEEAKIIENSNSNSLGKDSKEKNLNSQENIQKRLSKRTKQSNKKSLKVSKNNSNSNNNSSDRESDYFTDDEEEALKEKVQQSKNMFEKMKFFNENKKQKESEINDGTKFFTTLRNEIIALTNEQKGLVNTINSILEKVKVENN